MDAEDTGARAGEVLSRAGLSRALASLASVARPLMSKVASDPVEAVLRRADMLDAEGASAAAFRAALLADTAPFAAYVIAARDTLGNVDALRWIERVYGHRPAVRDPSWFERNAYASPLDSRAAERDLGWIARDDWPAVIRSVTGRRELAS